MLLSNYYEQEKKCKAKLLWIIKKDVYILHISFIASFILMLFKNNFKNN